MTRNMPLMPPSKPANEDRSAQDVNPAHQQPPTSSEPPHPAADETPRKRRAPLAYGRDYSSFSPRDFARPFCRFLTNNPTVFHAVDRVGQQLSNNGFKKLSERHDWKLEKGGKYYVERNGSSLIAFSVGKNYRPGNGIAAIGGHVDALTAKLKPIPGLRTNEGYVQLGVAPYAGGLNTTWWDRDLGIAGKVLVRDKDGQVTKKLVNLNDPIARIPTLAPHFGQLAQGPFNQETQMVPIIGVDNSGEERKALGDVGTFAHSQPPQLVEAVVQELGLEDMNGILNWDLELYDVQPATVGGLKKELIYGGRIDDKLCSWAAIQALLASCHDQSSSSSGADEGSIKMVALFDNEEIGSLTRQGARSDFFSTTISRVVEGLYTATTLNPLPTSTLARTYANSFLLSADVTHAFNPNFASAYLPNHSPRLNTGLTISYDSNGHMSTDASSTAFMQECARRSKSTLQAFQIRNDVRSGGTIGPMTASKTGIRTIDVGIVQLSMHSIRATTGADDPGLGVQAFKGFFDYFEDVDAQFQ